jgi:hypothetical protein
MNFSNNMSLSLTGRAVLLSLLLLTPGAARAISVGQTDNFGDSTLQGWEMGVNTVTASHMTNIADGGPAGAGDNFLQVVSDGTNVAGGRLTFFNRLQWTGDYTAAGVTAIAMDLENISSSEALNLRLAINGGFRDPSFNFIGGVFATSASISLDSGSGWTRAVFSLLPGDLVSVSGGIGGNTTGNDVQASLANVLELRLLNSATPDWNGLPVAATLGIDNMQAVAVPLPPALALFASGLLVLLARRRKPTLQAE